MKKWIRTSRLSIKKSLSCDLEVASRHAVLPELRYLPLHVFLLLLLGVRSLELSDTKVHEP